MLTKDVSCQLHNILMDLEPPVSVSPELMGLQTPLFPFTSNLTQALLGSLLISSRESEHRV
jgi:hypothetical protein